MKRLFLLPLIFLMACGPSTKIESSDMLTEKAVVVTLTHSPSEHHTELTPTMVGYNSITGVDYDGNTGVRVGNTFQITSTTIPEKFGSVFQCQHGTFTVEGSGSKYAILHDKLKNRIGDTVTILYKEQYKVTYEKVDGKKIPTSRVLYKLDFIDAQ